MTVKWVCYPDMERIENNKENGREYIGREVLVEEKRDGENVSLWWDGERYRVSSHRRVDADVKIVERLKSTVDYANGVLMLDHLREFGREYIVYGELLANISPTRLEPRRKHLRWVVFDMFDLGSGVFVPYNYMYQMLYHYRIPSPRIVDRLVPDSVNDLVSKKDEWMKWCRKHRREGVVIKAYGFPRDIFSKEKVDIPKLPKLVVPQGIRFPPMDEHTIQRALEHARDECGANFGDKRVAMPVVAKHFALEAREHSFAQPRDLYNLYLEFLRKFGD
jgi:hypothetical protein